jgi:hypothetical protein
MPPSLPDVAMCDCAAHSHRLMRADSSHLTRDAKCAIDAGDTVFAREFKPFLQHACDIGGRRPISPMPPSRRMRAHWRRELDRLFNLKPTNAEGRHLRDAIIVDAQDKLLIFLRRRDVEPTTVPGVGRARWRSN